MGVGEVEGWNGTWNGAVRMKMCTSRPGTMQLETSSLLAIMMEWRFMILGVTSYAWF